ncbi:MAG: hypothetical protein ACHQD8_03930 [Chitinophagales bacterium]
MQENHYLVPLHQDGFRKDLEHNIVADSIEDAEYWFVDVKDRLLDVNSWNKYCPAISAGFRLTDSHGQGVGRHARKGDLIRMDIQKKGITTRLAGFDWVCIEAIEYDDYPDLSMETFAIRVRAAAQNPLNNKEGHNPDTDATFTFVIERRGPKLFATYHSRNGSGNVADTTASLWLELPDTEWLSLIKGLLG